MYFQTGQDLKYSVGNLGGVRSFRGELLIVKLNDGGL